MPERPPFDPIRASFYLVAFVIFVHAAVVLLGAVQCVMREVDVCDAKGRLGDLLAGALAAALAFAGGFIRNKPPEDKP